jgi:arabinogalactan endo-1,4-beta-galactosidase
MAIGADVSFLPQAEAQGTVFRMNGQQTEGLQILQAKGYNWVRLRLFVEPTQQPNTLAYTIAEAQKAKSMGFKFLLDLHYSDTWADPTKQGIPAAWQNMNHAQLVAEVQTWTQQTIAAFVAASVQPDAVQIGNEVSNGILWPDGQLPYNWQSFLDLVSAGIAGLQAATPAGNRPLIVFHDDQGGNMYGTWWFFDHLVAANVPFDVIGLSYYPWWQGSLASLQQNLAGSGARYGKPIFVVETAYAWQTMNYPAGDGPYPETRAGQRAFYDDVAKAVTTSTNGVGVFWWEPAVSSSTESALTPRSLFDDKGHELGALNVYKKCL